MSNPSWCNNCEECDLIYHYCYTPYIDSNYEYCEHCNVEEYRFNNDEGYRCKIFEKALRSACEELHIHSIDPCCDLANPSLHNIEEIEEYFLQKVREKND